MRVLHSFALGLVTLSLLAWNVGCGDDDDGGGVQIDEDPTANIVEIVSASEDFEVLTAALTRAELTGTLSGSGPYTVFAPTDRAFDQLPEGTLDSLSEEELQTLLLYHVVAGRFRSDDLNDGPIMTAADLTAFVDANGDVEINQVRVVDADVDALNGVIHAIDEVLFTPDIVRALELAGDFEELSAALERADLLGELRQPGPYTVFAPTDDAFDALPEGTVDDLSDPQLRDILLFHVIEAEVLSDDLESGAVQTMLSGEQVDIDLSDGSVRVEDARVVAPDIVTTNGVIHAIDTVLLP